MKPFPKDAEITLAQGQQFVFLDSVDAISKIKSAWLDLERQSRDPCFFQGYAWCAHVAEVLSRSGRGSYRPLVGVYVRDGVVRAIWPLSLRYHMFRWSLLSIDDPFGQFSGILALDQQDADTLVCAMFEHVRDWRVAVTAQFERVIADGKLLGALRNLSNFECLESPGSLAPVINVCEFASFDALRSSRNKKTMKNLRNARNRLERIGPVSARIVESGEALDALVLRTVQDRMNWMEKNAVTSPAFRTPCHLDAVSGVDDTGLSQLRIGFEVFSLGKPLAHQWGFIHNRRYYAYMSGFDLSQMHMSPGRLHLADTIEQIFGLEVDAIELLTPASPYKLTWTDEVRDLVDVSADFGLVGFATGAVWQRTLRPALKSLYYALPISVRRRIPI